MASMETTVDPSLLMKNVTMTVRIAKSWAVRQWLAIRLFRLAAWVLGCGIDVESLPTTKPFGPVTIDRWRALAAAGIPLRVFVRGEDVTTRCRYVDDTPGHEFAELYLHNGQGHKYLVEERVVATEFATGKDVEIRIGE
jgi:hypothetical protein